MTTAEQQQTTRRRVALGALAPLVWYRRFYPRLLALCICADRLSRLCLVEDFVRSTGVHLLDLALTLSSNGHSITRKGIP